MNLNIDDSEFISIKTFSNPISRKILVILAPAPKGDYNYNFLLDKTDKKRIMDLLEVDNPFKIDFRNVADGFGNLTQAVAEVNKLKIGWDALGYTTTVIGNAFVDDSNILYINWK